MKRILVLILLVFCSVGSVFCQNTKQDRLMDKAYEYLQQDRKDKCLETLKNIADKYPDYAPCWVAMAELYLSDKDYVRSIEAYKKSISIDADYDLNSYYHLGKLLKQQKDYTKAREYFTVYSQKQTKPRYKDRVAESLQEIENIDFILKSKENPVEFTPKHIDRNINDTSYQYLPTLTADEMLYFTQRENNREDFYYAVKDADSPDSLHWGRKMKMPQPLNSDDNEGAGSISPDGKYLYFAKCNTKDGMGSCDIYRARRTGNTWGAVENLGPNVNSRAWDSQPSIASDNRTLFFASNREGGEGQSDIWYSYLKNDGTWTKAKNLKAVNTKGMETSPFIHPSNTTLYFSSDGRTGMGGMDIYYCRIDGGTVQEPVNLGWPINTENDESCLVVSSDGTYAVYAAEREDSYGKTDLYWFSLYDKARPTPAICMKGHVIYEDGKTGNEALFEIKDVKTNKLVASTFSDKVLNDYILTLPLGKEYALSVKCKGYLFYSENFSLENTHSADKYLIKDIHLQPIEEGSSVTLTNIFFETDSYVLKAESMTEIETLCSILNENPTLTIEIAGHTDNTGSAAHNLTLSQKRAESVRKALIDKGISETRITAKGYGSSSPAADNSTEEGRQANRRTAFRITHK